MNFYSEYGEDRWIWENVPWMQEVHGPDCHYLDIGAMRPEVNSNTAFLRDLGWKGLAIDGHTDCAPWWKDVPRTRFLCEVLDAEEREVTFFHDEQGSRIIRPATGPPKPDAVGEPPSATRGPRVLPKPPRVLPGLTERRRAVTLNSILHAQTQWKDLWLHFLSIDVEGFEHEVLKNVDFDYWRPNVIVAGYNTLGIWEDYRLRDWLVGSGRYRVAHQTVANLIYLRK